MNRLVVRHPVQTPVLVVLATLWGLIGVASFAAGDVLADRDWPGVVLAAGCIAIGLYGVVRAIRMGVVIDERGVHVRTLGRDETFTWSEVSSITCEPVGPDDGLGHVRVNVTGRKVPFVGLGTYPRDIAEYEVSQLRAAWERAVDHPDTNVPKV